MNRRLTFRRQATVAGALSMREGAGTLLFRRLSYAPVKQHRCFVPFTSFSEYEKAGRPAEPVWFAFGEDRPLAFFAGIWTDWTSVRKLKEGEIKAALFGFLTTDANADFAAIHPKAMPVILTGADEIDAWLTAPVDEALTLQRPLPDGALTIVARGALGCGVVCGPAGSRFLSPPCPSPRRFTPPRTISSPGM